MELHTKVHLILTIVWAVIGTLAVIGAILQVLGINIPPLLWLLGVAFISLCSIYANLVGHWSAFEAARAAEKKSGRKVIK